MLQGNTTNLPLQNIFQTLAMNQQEGILSISFQRQERHVGIRKSGIFLLCERSYSSRILQQILSIRGVLSESEFENVFATAGAPAPPGDLLLSRHVLQRNQIVETLREQLLEFTYEIFEWRNANYRFEVKPIPEDRMLFTDPEIARAFSFPANAVLMEAVRREDEWGRIRSTIPNQHQIFKPVPDAKLPEALSTAVNLAPARLQALLMLINGERTVEEIILDSRTPAFFVCSILHTLIGAGVVQPLSLEEKRGFAEVLRKRYQLDKVANVYRSILEEDPDDLDTRRKLVIFLERKKAAPQELIPHYHRLVDATRRKGDLPQTEQYLAKILELNPKDVEATEQRVLIHANDKKNKDWNQAVKDYVSSVRSNREFERGARFLLQIAEARQVEGAVIHEAAHLFLLAGNVAEASSTYERAAKVFTTEGDRQSLQKVIEKLEVCNAPAAARWRKQLNTPRRTGKRSRKRVLLLVVVALATAALGYGAYEWDARVSYAEVLESATQAARFGNLDDARRLLLEFKKRHEFSIIAQSIDRAIADVDAIATTERGSVERIPVTPEQGVVAAIDVERLMTEGATLKRKGEYTRALDLYRSVDLRTLPPAVAATISQEIASTGDYLKSAAALFESGKAAESANNLEEAHRIYSQCLTKYPYAPCARVVRLPLVLEIEPQTAVVAVNGAPISGPPYVLWLNPKDEPFLSVSAPSFLPWKKPVNARESAKMSVQLQKKHAWLQTLPAFSETEACAFNGRVFIGTRGGTLIALDEQTGVQQWEFRLEGLGDCLGAIYRWKDDIVFAGTDGGIYRVAADTGTLVHRISLPAGAGFSRVPFTPPGEFGTICLTTTHGSLISLDLEAQRVVWEKEIGGNGDLPPTRNGALVLAGDRSGRIAAFEIATGNRVWIREFRETLSTPALMLGEKALVSLETGRIAAMHVADGSEAWSTKLGAPARGTLLALGPDTFGVLTGDGSLLRMRAGDGSEIWEARTRAKYSQGPRAHGDMLFVLDDAGHLGVFHAGSGLRAWSYDTGEIPSSAPLVTDEFIFLSSKNRRIHAINLFR